MLKFGEHDRHKIQNKFCTHHGTQIWSQLAELLPSQRSLQKDVPPKHYIDAKFWDHHNNTWVFCSLATIKKAPSSAHHKNQPKATAHTRGSFLVLHSYNSILYYKHTKLQLDTKLALRLLPTGWVLHAEEKAKVK
jgi:hypothetical protein